MNSDNLKIKPRILCVDDEQNVLDSFKRLLRKDYDVNVANSGDMGLKLLEQNGPYAVIVSDFKMPQMDGIEFLTKARDIAPDTVRIMLTGQADDNTAILAINDGRIFRFLGKPITNTLLTQCLEDGIKQYNLIVAEKDILEKTLKGCIEMMTEILSLTNPLAFSRAIRVADYAKQLANSFGLRDIWQIEVASLLYHMGYISIPNETLQKKANGRELSSHEIQMFEDIPKVTEKLIGHISRLEDTLSIIKKVQSNESFATISLSDSLTVSAAILKSVLRFDELIDKNFGKIEAINEMSRYSRDHNSNIIHQLKTIKLVNVGQKTKQISINQLRVGMVLNETIKTTDGLTVAPKGFKVNDLIKHLLKNLYLQDSIAEFVEVLVLKETK